MAQNNRSDLALAASAGGHLDLLLAIAPSLPGVERALWVSSRTPRGELLRDGTRRVVLMPDPGRRPLAALANLRRSVGLVLRHRPRVLVTTGAGFTVPLAVCAKLAGTRVIFIETMARVVSPSRSATVLSRLASHTIVQWPELADALPRATVCAPLLLNNIPDGPRATGEGTFVAVGTHRQGFERLLEMTRVAARRGVLPEPIWAQTGSSEPSDGQAGAPFISSTELEKRLHRSAVVVCHGGAGIISTCLASGRTPIVVPRRSHRDEHFDDHQLQLAWRLARWELVVVAEEEITAEMVQRSEAPLSIPAELSEAPAIAETLRAQVVALASG